jgi:hypothetical protein
VEFAAALAQRLERSTRLDRWRADPVAWVQERLGEAVWSKQAEVLRSVAANKLTAVQSSHGVGKSFVASRIVGHYLDCYPTGDFFVVTTAPTWAQVRAILWRYIGQMAAAHDLPGYVTQQAEWKVGNELVAFGRKPADTDNQGLQGLHARRGVVAIIDEGSGVPDQIYNAVDSLATTPESRIVVLGNPDSVSSRFYRVCTSEPGWHRIKVSSFDTPAWTGEQVPADVAAGLVSREWAEDKLLRWGERSPLYRIKVCGEFAPDDDTALIPLSWVQAAHERWQVWNERPDRDVVQVPGRTILGVDVGHMGEDRTVIATVKGDTVMSIESWARQDTVAVTGLVEARLVGHVRPVAVVDAIGVGAGVVDLLRAHRAPVRPFVASAATKRRDASGSQRFRNLRSAAYWNLRELLDPALGATLALPPDDDLTADLTTPRWEPRTGGVIEVEGKDDIRKRLGRSTDYSDAVAMACWSDLTREVDTTPVRPRVRQFSDAQFDTGGGVPAWQ